MKNTLSVIIVNFNTKKLLRDCLESLISSFKEIRKKDKDFYLEIIIVDNGSKDGSVEMIGKEFLPKAIHASYPEIFLIENIYNWGFAGAVNKGIKKSKGEFIFLLNSDTIVNPEALKKALDFFKNKKQAIAGLKLINLDGSIQPSVYHFPTILRAIKEFWFNIKNSYQKYYPKTKEPIKVDAVTGAAMIFPKSIVKKIGMLDEKYFFYFEDLDFCRKAFKNNIPVFYLPQAEIIHHHGASGIEMQEIVHQWLVESSKKYNGLLKYYLLTLVIWLGQKIKRIPLKIKNIR
jgi:GT2 family glycosyltransferase